MQWQEVKKKIENKCIQRNLKNKAYNDKEAY